MKKIISYALAFSMVFGSAAMLPQGADTALGMPGVIAAAPAVNAESATIYALSDWSQKFISVPAGKGDHQIKVTGASDVTYSVYSGNSVTVSDTGLVEPNYKKTYWYSTGGMYMVGYSSPQEGKEPIKISTDLITGTSKIKVTADGTVMYVDVTVTGYEKIYAEEVLDDYIAGHITSGMTDKEKITEAAKMAAGYDYSASGSSATYMLVAKGGDCWASTDLIIQFCEKLGLKAWSRNGNRDIGAGSGHMNAMVKTSDGTYYEVEAGYSGTAPRMYSVRERKTLFSYRTDSTLGGKEVYQYDGEENPEKLVVPDEIDGVPVVSIGESFVSSESGIKEIVLPDSVKKICESAFGSCSDLEKINLPASLETIEQYVFAKDYMLKDVTVPDGCAFVYKDGAFYDKGYTTLISAPAASEIEIPDTVTRISDTAFFNNKNIKIISLPEGVTEIGMGAFYNCGSLEWVKLHENVETIGDYAFGQSKKISKLVVPDSVGTIGSNAFTGCEKTMTVYASQGSKASELAQSKDMAAEPETRISGDADNSGKLNINDVLITQQYIAGWDVKIDYYGADANGDGWININDVLLAQQKIAGWDVTLF